MGRRDEISSGTAVETLSARTHQSKPVPFRNLVRVVEDERTSSRVDSCRDPVITIVVDSYNPGSTIYDVPAALRARLELVWWDASRACQGMERAKGWNGKTISAYHGP